MKKAIVFFAASILFVLSIIAADSAYGQEIKIKGSILDSLSGNAEISAIVQFYKSDDLSKPVAYTTTDENGAFSHTLSEKGAYKLLLDNLGRKKKYIDFTIGDQTEFDFGSILTQEDATLIKAGTVTALSQRVEIQADRITYMVDTDIEAKTKSVLEILRKIPLVSVDARDVITINGSSTFLVYMDGIKNQMMTDNPTEVFRAMPASMIKNIEVVTDPGARYDAEGASAVLNITSLVRQAKNQDEESYNGSLNFGVSLKRVLGGAYLSAKKGKLALSMNVNTINVWTNRDDLLTSERINETPSGQMMTISAGNSSSLSKNVFSNLSASYEIDKYNFVTLSAGYMGVRNSADEFLNTMISLPSLLYEYDNNTYSFLKYNIYNANIDFQHIWKDNSAKNFVISYEISGRPINNYMDNTYSYDSVLPKELYDIKDYDITNSLTHSIQTDFNIPFGKNHNISTGVKFRLRHNFADHKSMRLLDNEYIEDESARVNYDFYNNIGALYTEYSGSFKSLRVRAGVRYEHTWQASNYNETKAKDFSINYGNIVPNGTIQYRINQKQNIGLTYSMNLRRPGITYLNPYVDISDPSAKVYGNPDLKSEIGHRIGLSYNLSGKKWLATMRLQQDFKNNGISSYLFYDKDNILNTTYDNILKLSTTSLTSYVSWNATEKTNIILDGSIGYNKFQSQKMNLNNSGWTYSMNANVEHILPSDFVLSSTLSYLPNSLSLQSSYDGFWDASISISKSFLDNKLNVRLRAQTNLKKSGALLRTEFFGNGVTAYDQIDTSWRDVFINISYSFGNNQNIQVKRSRKSSSSNDQVDLNNS